MAHLSKRRPDAALMLQDGTVLRGFGAGAAGRQVGELVFNTAMTGYQEILTDPSYAGQIITFTFPHIGIVGTNPEDVEAGEPAARAMVTRAPLSHPSNWRARQTLEEWLERHGVTAITGVDTRRLTRLLRRGGAQNAVVAYRPGGEPDLQAMGAALAAWPGLVGMDLASEVSGRQRYLWRQSRWRWPDGYGEREPSGPHAVVVDYGVKRNILRSLVSAGFRVTVVPARTEFAAIRSLEPDGVVLANGPGDPAATASAYAAAQIRACLDHGLPLFGICLGHQMLGLALGARTEKMPFGHHGANHPVQDLTTGRVEITSQNHGFAISDRDLPETVEVTHRSLFDGTIQGIRLRDRPAFSVQYHPEASPGPMDSHYLFERFRRLVERTAG